VVGDPRYPAGSVGSPADAMSCTGSLAIPDQFTGHFDSIGEFTEPSQLTIGASIAYDATSRVSYQLNLLNIESTCWGGSQTPWTKAASSNHWCIYGANPSFIPATGNFYNPGANLKQGYWYYPYYPGQTYNSTLGVTSPFTATFNVQIKI